MVFMLARFKTFVPEKKFGFIKYGKRQFYFHFNSGQFVAEQQVRFKLKAGRSDSQVEAYDVVPL